MLLSKLSFSTLGALQEGETLTLAQVSESKESCILSTGNYPCYLVTTYREKNLKKNRYVYIQLNHCVVT